MTNEVDFLINHVKIRSEIVIFGQRKVAVFHLKVGVVGTIISVGLRGITLILLHGKIVDGGEEVLNGHLIVSLIIRDSIEPFLCVELFVLFLKIR